MTPVSAFRDSFGGTTASPSPTVRWPDCWPAVVVVGADGSVVYTELVPEIASEPGPTTPPWPLPADASGRRCICEGADRRTSVAAVSNLAYDDTGSGEPVLFIAGTGGAGRTWHIHQVPDFLRAGYRCITFDNRGVGATENAEGFTTGQMVADTVGIIEETGRRPGPTGGDVDGRIHRPGTDAGPPDLVHQAALMGTRGRVDPTRIAFRTADLELAEAGIDLPPSVRRESPHPGELLAKTINSPMIEEWLQMFTAFPLKRSPGWRAQLGWRRWRTACRRTGRSPTRCSSSASLTT